MEEDKIRLEDFCTMMVYLEDKSDLYKIKLFAADCDESQMDSVDGLPDEVVNERIRYYSEQFNIQAQFHEEIEGYKLPAAKEISVEMWIKVMDTVSSYENPILAYPAIFQALTGASFREAADLGHKKPAEAISFFLQNLNPSTLTLESFSNKEKQKLMKELLKLARRQLLNQYTQFPKVKLPNLKK